MHVKEERKRERKELVKAWNLLDDAGDGHITTQDKRLPHLFRFIRPKVMCDTYTVCKILSDNGSIILC